MQKSTKQKPNAMTWVVILFVRVKKEVDDVIGMKQDITCDDLGKLVYLSQVNIITLAYDGLVKHVVKPLCNLLGYALIYSFRDLA